MSRNHRVVKLLAVGLMVSVCVAATSSLGRALNASADVAASMTFDEEEGASGDEAVADDLPTLRFLRLSHRWDVEQRAPAPVHLERKGRPPSS